MDELTIQTWVHALTAEIETLRARRAEIDAEIQQKSKKLDLLRQMLSLEATGTSSVEASTGGRATPNSVRECTRTILTEAGTPMHINDIHREFQRRGYMIPGAGTPFNILVHLTSGSEFVRVARGTYAVAGSVPDEQVLRKAPRRSRKRKRQRALPPRQEA